jgi:hypothetical protein
MSKHAQMRRVPATLVYLSSQTPTFHLVVYISRPSVSTNRRLWLTEWNSWTSSGAVPVLCLPQTSRLNVNRCSAFGVVHFRVPKGLLASQVAMIYLLPPSPRQQMRGVRDPTLMARQSFPLQKFAQPPRLHWHDVHIEFLNTGQKKKVVAYSFAWRDWVKPCKCSITWRWTQVHKPKLSARGVWVRNLTSNHRLTTCCAEDNICA